MIKLLYKPTTVAITTNAMKTAKKLYGEDNASLMFASLKTLETKPPKNNSFFCKLIDKIATKLELKLTVDATPKDEFVVNAKRKIGIYEFKGEKQKFALDSTLATMSEFKKAVLQSKAQILNELGQFNKFKKMVILVRPNKLILH